jgi:DNA-directed RNA polymerase subunit K/omega
VTGESAAVAALQAAATSFGGQLFGQAACLDGVAGAAKRVTDLAEIYETWLRRIRSGKLTLVAIEEIADGTIVWTPTEGEPHHMSRIDSSQRARYTFKAKDDMGYAADYALAARLHEGDPAIATVEYLNVGDPGNTTNGTTDPDTGASTEYDQVLATFAGVFGDATVEVYDPAGDTTVVIASDPLTAEPGAVATGTLGVPVIEEIPVP